MDAHSVLSSLIAAGVTQAPSLDPVKPPQTGFNPVIKAFAFALRTFTTLDDDLAASGQVFLIGGPRQYGLPTSLQDEKYLNDAMFNTCDPIQSSLTPVYSQGGPSYFEWLRGYIHNVEDVSSSLPLTFSKTKPPHTIFPQAAKRRQGETSVGQRGVPSC